MEKHAVIQEFLGGNPDCTDRNIEAFAEEIISFGDKMKSIIRRQKTDKELIGELKSEIREYQKACKMMLRDRDKKVIENRKYKEMLEKIKKESFSMCKKGRRDDETFIMSDSEKIRIIIRIYNIANIALEDTLKKY